jgi:GntR family transcriptional regulator
MDPQWDEGSPIYRQLRDRVVAMILEGVLKEGDPLPSVRSVAAEFRLNPLTVLKGYQQLVDESLVEKRRGRGMYVNVGARQALMKDEKQRFLDDEWPKVHAVIVRLGLSIDELMKVPPAKNAAPSTAAQLADQALRDDLAGGDPDGLAGDDFDAGQGPGPRQGDER